MVDNLFLFDYKASQSKGYSQLITDINEVHNLSRHCCTDNLYQTFLIIIASILHNQNLILLDADFSEQELTNLQIDKTDLTQLKPVKRLSISSIEEMLNIINAHQDWELTLFTSGTTGIPKKVVHRLSSLTRAVRSGEKHQVDIWGFAYNPTHIAGLQVFFQALLNTNTIINLFEADRDKVLRFISEYSITNISATPTFFRMLLPISEVFPTVKKLTSGGEKFDSKLASNLLKAFPHAKLRNVYASTEAGTILESRDDVFSILDESLCKIEDGELYIHKSLLGEGLKGTIEDSQWYATGDLIELVTESPLSFRFLQRKNEMINIGGYKVNPLEIEHALEQHHCIKQAYVFGKPNPVLGNILMADVVIKETITEKELREFLAPLLQPYKIPRFISFVEAISLTRTGKMKRT